MKNKQRFFIELLATTINSSGFIGISIPQKVFTSYVKIKGEKKELKKDLQKEYGRVTKNYFEDNIDLSAYRESVDKKIASFERLIGKSSPIGSYDFSPNEVLRTKFRAVYDFYCSKTGQKRSKPFTINRYDKSEINILGKRVEQIARDLLEIDLLTEIQDELQFFEIYSSYDLKTVEKVADACWELYESNNQIRREELIDRVLMEYHIKKYDDESSEKTQKKKEKAVKQWIRDVKENNNIEIEK